MKPLKDQTNVEKGKLLHELFPREIKGFLEFAIGYADHTHNSKMKLEANWSNQLISLNTWLSIAEDAKKRMLRYAAQLPEKSGLFADQLFDGYTALWTVDTLLKYVSPSDFENAKFKGMVKVLFCPK